MNKKYFIGLAAYNNWADNIAIEWLKQINDEQWNQMNISSFSSVNQTAVHIASAEKIWVDFWKNSSNPIYLSSEFKGTKGELIEIWKKASNNINDFLNEYPEENYLHSISFRYPSGRIGEMEFWQTFSHIINHSTYHRGQLVTLLRQAGFTNLSSIDLATYYILHQR